MLRRRFMNSISHGERNWTGVGVVDLFINRRGKLPSRHALQEKSSLAITNNLGSKIKRIKIIGLLAVSFDLKSGEKKAVSQIMTTHAITEPPVKTWRLNIGYRSDFFLISLASTSKIKSSDSHAQLDQ
jgi:hypothetical protein